MTVPQADATTDPQSIIVALQQKLDAALSAKAALEHELAARTAELAKRTSEYGEQIEHRSAVVDVLKAMSVSADDPQPVFEAIARRACEVCKAPSAAVLTFDGTQAHFSALYPASG